MQLSVILSTAHACMFSLSFHLAYYSSEKVNVTMMTIEVNNIGIRLFKMEKFDNGIEYYRFKCDKCLLTFSQKRKHENHKCRTTKGEILKYRHSCGLCGRCFRCYNALGGHQDDCKIHSKILKSWWDKLSGDDKMLDSNFAEECARSMVQFCRFKIFHQLFAKEYKISFEQCIALESDYPTTQNMISLLYFFKKI